MSSGVEAACLPEAVRIAFVSVPPASTATNVARKTKLSAASVTVPKSKRNDRSIDSVPALIFLCSTALCSFSSVCRTRLVPDSLHAIDFDRDREHRILFRRLRGRRVDPQTFDTQVMYMIRDAGKKILKLIDGHGGDDTQTDCVEAIHVGRAQRRQRLNARVN